MTALVIIVVVTVIGLLLLVQFSKSDEKDHHERIESLAKQIASRQPVQERPEPPRIERPSDELSYLFELKGLYYRDSDAQEEARHLKPGDTLKLLQESKNRKDKFAVMVCSAHNFIGYVPRDISEKVCRNLDQIEKCEVDFTAGVDEIPDVLCRLFFKGKTVFYWEDYLESLKVYDEYKVKYPILQTLKEYELDDIQSRVEIWKKLHEENPEDVYLEYNYIYALYLNRDYTTFVSLGEEFRERLKLRGWEKLDTILMVAQDKVNRLKEAEIREEYVAIYQQSRELMAKKEYDAALQGFLRCMDSPYQVQALPRNICKCYEKLGRVEDCANFAKDALKRSWLSPATVTSLQKYIGHN